MQINFSVSKTINDRYSVRTFGKSPVEKELRQQILDYAHSIESPFGVQPNFKFIEKKTSANGEKLGTYGIIKGAELYLGVTIPNQAGAMESVGYVFEQLVLYMTSLGLGTCWLGGTFNKGAFANAMELKEDELFPIVSPIGYPADKKRFGEKLFRRTLKADQRKPWKDLFFVNDFSTSLTPEMAGQYEYPMEMVRLAPSAVNKQPWRIVWDENGFHFFEKHSLGTESAVVDMQRIDVGIAACHFDLAARERGIIGKFEKRTPGDLVIPTGMSYVTSWVENK